MALQKSITTENGATANYWKIDRLDIDYETQSIFTVVKVYLDKSARDSGKKPFNEDYEYNALWTQATASENIRENIYNALKSEDFFEGASDV